MFSKSLDEYIVIEHKHVIEEDIYDNTPISSSTHLCDNLYHDTVVKKEIQEKKAIVPEYTKNEITPFFELHPKDSYKKYDVLLEPKEKSKSEINILPLFNYSHGPFLLSNVYLAESANIGRSNAIKQLIKYSRYRSFIRGKYVNSCNKEQIQKKEL